ncbi:ER membrane protein complex subunit 7, partial [Gryganskiella cystojenkinii]
VSMKTRVILSGGLYRTHINSDGTFEFSDVPTGTYLLEVQSPQLVYSKVRIVVTSNEVLATRVSVGEHFSGNKKFLPMPLTLRPRPRPIHYIPPEGQKVASWFGNPMILMSGFSLFMANADAIEALRSSYDFGCLPTMGPLSNAPSGSSSRHPPNVPPHHFHPNYQHQQQLQHYQDQHSTSTMSSQVSSSKDPYLVGGAGDEKNEFGDEFSTGVVPTWGEKKGMVAAAATAQAGPAASVVTNAGQHLPHYSYPSYPHNQKKQQVFPPQPQPQSVPFQQQHLHHHQQFIPPVQSKKLK